MQTTGCLGSSGERAGREGGLAAAAALLGQALLELSRLAVLLLVRSQKLSCLSVG